MRILLAVDGSKHSLNAVQFLIDHAGWLKDAPELDLVTVHLPVPRLPGMGAAGARASSTSTTRRRASAASLPRGKSWTRPACATRCTLWSGRWRRAW